MACPCGGREICISEWSTGRGGLCVAAAWVHHPRVCDLGILSFYLGIEVHQGKYAITLNQGNYATSILDIVGLRNCNPSPTSMEERLKLSRESTTQEIDATELADQWKSGTSSTRGLISPDLNFSVGYGSRLMERPAVEHMGAVKRLLRYITGTIDYGLSCPRSSGEENWLAIRKATTLATLTP